MRPWRSVIQVTRIHKGIDMNESSLLEPRTKALALALVPRLNSINLKLSVAVKIKVAQHLVYGNQGFHQILLSTPKRQAVDRIQRISGWVSKCV